jgi:UPF0271 protein
MQDPGLAHAVIEAIRAFSRSLFVFCLPDSEVERAAHELGLLVVLEGFADRAYEPNGSLVDRTLTGAVLSDDEAAAEQAVSLAGGQVQARDGTVVQLKVGTICVHGDNPAALALVVAVRARLERAGLTIAPPAR